MVLDTLLREVEESRRALEEELERLREDARRLIKAPFTIEHREYLEAFVADVADVIPIVGEIAGLARLLEAREKGDRVRFILELIDLVAGAPPVIGEIFDLIAPTNLYFYRRRLARQGGST